MSNLDINTDIELRVIATDILAVDEFDPNIAAALLSISVNSPEAFDYFFNRAVETFVSSEPEVSREDAANTIEDDTIAEYFTFNISTQTAEVFTTYVQDFISRKYR